MAVSKMAAKERGAGGGEHRRSQPQIAFALQWLALAFVHVIMVEEGVVPVVANDAALKQLALARLEDDVVREHHHCRLGHRDVVRSKESDLRSDAVLSLRGQETLSTSLHRRLASRDAGLLCQRTRAGVHALGSQQLRCLLGSQLAVVDSFGHLLETFSVHSPRPFLAVRYAVTVTRGTPQQPGAEWRLRSGPGWERGGWLREGGDKGFPRVGAGGTTHLHPCCPQRAECHVMVTGGRAQCQTKSDCPERPAELLLGCLPTPLPWISVDHGRPALGRHECKGRQASVHTHTGLRLWLTCRGWTVGKCWARCQRLAGLQLVQRGVSDQQWPVQTHRVQVCALYLVGSSAAQR